MQNENLNQFLKEKEARLARATLVRYEKTLVMFDRYMTQSNESDLTRKLAVNFLLDLRAQNFSDSYCSLIESVLKALYEWATSIGLIPANPLTGKIIQYKAKLRNEDFPFTEPEYVRVREYIKKNVVSVRRRFWYGAIIMGWNTGLRLGDVALFNINSVHWPEKMIRIEPNKVKRFAQVLEIPLQPELHDFLSAQKDCKGYVFPVMADLYKNQPSDLPSQFTRLCMKAGVQGKSFHALRHAMASRLLNKNIPLSVIGSITGQSIQVLSRYSHVSLDQKRKALAQL